MVIVVFLCTDGLSQEADGLSQKLQNLKHILTTPPKQSSSLIASPYCTPPPMDALMDEECWVIDLHHSPIWPKPKCAQEHSVQNGLNQIQVWFMCKPQTQITTTNHPTPCYSPWNHISNYLLTSNYLFSHWAVLWAFTSRFPSRTQFLVAQPFF